MKFTLILASFLSVVAAAPNPQITAAPVAPECPIEKCGVVTSSIWPTAICALVRCASPPVCPMIASVTFPPCCCQTQTLKTVTTTRKCCTNSCIIPTYTEYPNCGPTSTKEPGKTVTVWVTETVDACVPTY